MNTISQGLKNWQSTIIGALLAAVVVIESTVNRGADIADWKTWILPALIAALGFVAKDAAKAAKCIVLLFVASCLSGCSFQVNPDGSKSGMLSPDAIPVVIRILADK